MPGNVPHNHPVTHLVCAAKSTLRPPAPHPLIHMHPPPPGVRRHEHAAPRLQVQHGLLLEGVQLEREVQRQAGAQLRGRRSRRGKRLLLPQAGVGGEGGAHGTSLPS